MLLSLSPSLSVSLLPTVNLTSGGIAAVAKPHMTETIMDKRTTTHGSLLRCLQMKCCWSRRKCPRKSLNLAHSLALLSLHKLSFLHTQTNDEQGGLMKVENEALEVPRRWV